VTRLPPSPAQPGAQASGELGGRFRSLAPARSSTLPLLVVCCLAALAVASASPPPAGESTARVVVSPLENRMLERAGLPDKLPVIPAGFLPSAGQVGAGVIEARGDTQGEAVSNARGAAFSYIADATRQEDRILDDLARARAPGSEPAARRDILSGPARYRVEIPAFVLTDTRAAKAARALVVGVLVALLLAIVCGDLVARLGGESSDGVAAARLPLGEVPILVVGAALSAGAIAVCGAGPASLYTAALVGLLGLCSLAYSVIGGTRAIRFLIAGVICLAPLRGLLLSLAGQAHLRDSLLIVNAILPAMIAGALGGLLAVRGTQIRSPRLLGLTVLALVAVSLLGVLTQTVGPKLYAIGVVQYAIYPTLALLAWNVLAPGDLPRLVRLLAALGALVAGSVFLEAIHAVRFVEAADPDSALGLGGARYGGITGSYLHASQFLGTVAVLVLGLVLASRSTRSTRWLAVALAVVLGGIAVTYSRGGFAIFAVGAVLLLVASDSKQRRRIAILGAVTLIAGLGVYAATGASTGNLISRIGSSGDLSGDPGNKDRFDSMRDMVNRWRDASAPQKALGVGLAATGNARQLTSSTPEPAESYPLKLLVETGVVGFLLLGGIFVAGAIQFVLVVRRRGDPVTQGAAAAGAGLSVQGLIYPTLETQLLAMTWWLLLVVCLAAAPTWLSAEWPRRRAAEPPPEPA
jgi:O-antigen ligase/polysaccharide polymerase Wzy-like membrane protein